MSLKFFRKHKKYGHILLLGALFAMVTFGALTGLRELMERRQRAAVAGTPVYDLPTMGVKVTREEDQDIRLNLRGMARFQMQLAQLFQQPELRSLLASPQMQPLFRYQSVLPMRFIEAGGIAETTLSEEALHEIYATAILMKEAEKAGIRVTEEMAEAHYGEWMTCGLPPQYLNAWLHEAFFEQTSPPTSFFRQRVLSAIRQEMTLSLYLQSLRHAGRAFSEDVDDFFRQVAENAEIDKVSLEFRRYLDGVAEPTEEQLVAHFKQYKDELADETENGFGCKIPNRVRFEYLKVKADVFRAEAVVTDKEIEDYYNLNKDMEFVVTPEEPKTPAAAPEPSATDAPSPTPTAPKAGSDNPDAAPSAAEDEKANDGGGVGLPATLAQAVPGQTATATESDPADAVGQTPASTPVPAVPSPAPATDAQTPATPAKTYRPLAEVREEIRTRLQNQKGADAARARAEEILSQLLQRPMLGLENLADDKYVVHYPAGDFLAQDQIRQVTTGIGTAAKMPSGKQWQRPIFFGDLVFSIDPFDPKPQIFLGRPDGVLIDGTKNAYLFVVREIQPAHVPASLNDVRDVVVRNVKKEAAFKLAETEAAEILAAAQQKGLEAAVAEKGLKLDPPPYGGDRHRVRRPSPRYDDPQGKAVFKVVDAGQSLGTVGDPQLDRVTVFQVKDVTRIQQSEYVERLPMFTVGTIQQQRQKALAALVDPERLMARSGFVTLEPEGEEDAQQPSGDAQQ